VESKIIKNAFRILGLPVTASKKEVVCRVEEIQTYITIEQTPQYDSDLPWIGELHRNTESVRKAVQSIDNPNTKLEHLISWFWDIDKFDKRALNSLKHKNVEEAIDIWSAATQQKYSHHKKNLITLEQILACQETASNYEHLKNSIKYWAELIASVKIPNLIKKIDVELSTNITDSQITKSIGNSIYQAANQFLKGWANADQLDQIGRFFKYLNESGLSQEIVGFVKDKYANPISEEIDKMCTAFSETDDKGNYEKIYTETRTFYKEVNPYFEQIKQSGNAFLIESYGDKIGGIILDNGIHYANKTGQWQKSEDIYELAETYITGLLLKERYETNFKVIKENLKQEKMWRGLEPIKKAPHLGAIYGIGTTLYGHSNYNFEPNCYETTRYFVFFGIPIIPLGRYRVIETGANYYRFLGKVLFRTFDKWHLGLGILLLLGMLRLFLGTDSNNYSSGTYTPPSSVSYSSSYETEPKSQEAGALKQKIDEDKMRLTKMESELASLRNTLEGYDNQLKRLKEDIDDAERKLRQGLYVNEVTYHSNIDNYNALVRVVENYQTKYAEYNRLFDVIDADINRYNRLIGAK